MAAFASPRLRRFGLPLLLLVAFGVILVRTAWMSDDAYITLRTVDNFIHGYGLTWNVAERVQSYTHPLWMFLLAAAYFVTHEAYFTTLVVSIVISLAALWLVVTRVAASRWAAVVGAAVLLLSKAFVDYSTSGLENPLTHLLLALFFVVYLRDEGGREKLFRLALITALIAVNRIDAVLLVAVPFVMALFQNCGLFRRNPLRAAGAVALGFLPFFAWELFSLFYYGFAIPNTAFAKLNTHISEAALLRQGVTYLVQSTRVDFFTSLVIIAGVVVALSARKLRIAAIVASALLYVGYVVWIGGDFMSGRFLAAPLFCVVVAVVASGCLPQGRVAAAALVVVLVAGIAAPRSPVWGDAFYPCAKGLSTLTGIEDERGCYFPGTGLVRQRAGQPFTPNHGLMKAGLETRDDALRVTTMGGIGMYGYAAGPTLYVVDLDALSDPLLARLPMPPGKPWRIGHFERLVPAGYLETLVGGENRVCNAGMREYYDGLRTVIRGPLFAAGRFGAIWKMNTGQYDRLLDAYANPDATDVQLCNASARTALRFQNAPALVGYDVPSFTVKAGSRLPVTLYWQRDGEAPSLASFVHVRPSKAGQAANPHSENGMWAQAEHFEPSGRSTSEYFPGQVYVHQYLLDLPADMPAGVYNFEIGWFNTEKGEQVEPLPETVKPPYAILWRSVLLPPLTVQ